MPAADPVHYLDGVCELLSRQWPQNRTVNIVCHGHSVPAGYFATPFVNTFGAYPHQLHRLIKERFPFAVVNVIVTAAGGENAAQGCARFDTEVLCHRPDVLTIDYALNDRQIGLEEARRAWEEMIEKALARGIRVILLTPSWDQSYYAKDENWHALVQHAELVRRLADRYGVGLADSFSRFEEQVKRDGGPAGLLAHVNHPTEKGHALIAQEVAKFFRAR